MPPIEPLDQPILAMLPLLTYVELDELAMALEARLAFLTTMMRGSYADLAPEDAEYRLRVTQSLLTAVREAQYSLRPE